jgi:carboxymethylenebutenolidase
MRINDPEGVIEFPSGGKGPGILVLHAWWGLNAFFGSLCKRLARQGYIVFAPDLYHGETATNIEGAKRLRAQLKQSLAEAEIHQAARYLQSLKGVQGAGLGVIGFSLGAYLGLGLSITQPRRVRAVVVFYGTRGGDYSKARAAYLGHFAETDPYASASGVKSLERALRKAGRPVTFHTYEGTGHWFFESDRKEAYDGGAARLAWKRTAEFLEEALSR